jgi:hypothetical protein
LKTIEQIKAEYKTQTLDGRDITRLIDFIPEEDLPSFGVTLKPEYVGKHEAKPLTREAVLEQLKEDVAFGFEKALNRRGLSAGMMFQVVQMWNWILEEGLEDFSEGDYAMYGLPLFKATAVKYDFANPIGEDTGSERKYDEDYDDEGED